MGRFSDLSTKSKDQAQKQHLKEVREAELKESHNAVVDGGRMLESFLSRDSEQNTRGALQAICLAAKGSTKITDDTSHFYRYPACFSPTLAREIIHQFTVHGDTVLDPFVGGGTTVVEASLMNRIGVGFDINELATFVAKAKLITPTDSDRKETEQWCAKVASLEQPNPWDEIRGFDIIKELAPDISNELIHIILLSSRYLDSMKSTKAQMICRSALLRSMQLAIDNKENMYSFEKGRSTIVATTEGIIRNLSAQRDQLKSASRTGYIYCGDVTNKSTLYRAAGRLENTKLILTSPPYPGISVLYNRWQINGRRETMLPYWLIGSSQYESSSFYTMGFPKSARGIEQYFSSIRSAFHNIGQITPRNVICAQIVAFGDRKSHFFPFLDAMSDAGFEEISNLLPSAYDGRIWRDVPNRRWYIRTRKETKKRKEAILFFAKKGQHR